MSFVCYLVVMRKKVDPRKKFLLNESSGGAITCHQTLKFVQLTVMGRKPQFK